MSEFDAAKMIGLGTILGKYQQKALLLKFITFDKFKEIKSSFINTLNKCYLYNLKPECFNGMKSNKLQTSWYEFLAD